MKNEPMLAFIVRHLHARPAITWSVVSEQRSDGKFIAYGEAELEGTSQTLTLEVEALSELTALSRFRSKVQGTLHMVSPEKA